MPLLITPISELKYKVMKTQLKKIFGDNPGSSSFESPMLDVKVESINETSHEEVLLSNNSK